MSSDAPDEFAEMMVAAGFKEVDTGTVTEEIVEYVGLTMTYDGDHGLPVRVRIEFPEGSAMDGARALVLSARADSIQSVLAGAAALGDASVFGYLDANGIDAAEYAREASTFFPDGPPSLDEADDFFTL